MKIVLCICNLVAVILSALRIFFLVYQANVLQWAGAKPGGFASSTLHPLILLSSPLIYFRGFLAVMPANGASKLGLEVQWKTCFLYIVSFIA